MPRFTSMATDASSSATSRWRRRSVLARSASAARMPFTACRPARMSVIATPTRVGSPPGWAGDGHHPAHRLGEEVEARPASARLAADGLVIRVPPSEG